MSLGKIGFQDATWKQEAIAIDCMKELARLENREWDSDTEKMSRHDLRTLNQNQILNLIKKINRKIKRLGGNEIGRK